MMVCTKFLPSSGAGNLHTSQSKPPHFTGRNRITETRHCRQDACRVSITIIIKPEVFQKPLANIVNIALNV